MALEASVENYFKTMSPLAAKVYEDIEDAKLAYDNIWNTLTEKEKVEILNESIIKPKIALKYALLDTLDFDINDPPVRKNDLMSFFGREHAQRVVQDENCMWRDEHSAPFLYQTKSQLNLCVLSENRQRSDTNASSSPPVLSELAVSHSKVVSELKNALKSHDVLRSTGFNMKNDSVDRECVVSPIGFISKLIGNKFKSKEDDKERLVAPPQNQLVASSDNFFKTNFKSPTGESKFDKEYRSSVVKSNSDVSEEQRGLLSSISQGSSTTEFHSCEEIDPKTDSTETLTTSTLPRTGYDFLDNW